MKSQTVEKYVDPSTSDGAAKLEIHVQCRLSGSVHDFRVDVANNGLVLRGHARTYYAKQLAQHAVMEATPLPIVANEIEVG